METEAKNVTSNVKLFSKEPFRELKDLRFKDLLRSNESRDHYHEDGYRMYSPQCGFCFEAYLLL